MACLDNRRLNAQHNETLIALSAMHKRLHEGAPAKGWNNAEQIRTFYGRRGALVSYYNQMVLPACQRRFHRSAKYGARAPFEYHPSDPPYILSIPPEERDLPFWECVTWRGGSP